MLVDICSGKNFPAVFTFGDSLADVGNNYYIETTAKPTLPNGIDFGTGDIILKGVNYASAASGILSDTGSIFGGHIGLEAQITNFGNTEQDIMNKIGTKAATSLLRESLYITAIGANDRLYFLGARKIVVTNCACIGNIPVRRAIFPNDFVVLLNQVVRYYNSRLKKMLTELTRRVLQDQCFDGISSCTTGFQVCKNRSKYVFWDQFHPTDIAHLITAKPFMDGGLNYILPKNIRQLMNFPVN
ncbi:hypothetical protein Q3G72_016981 [Acer saccharum]|nr:hypothetical protein Q3G72_016981 [Acer saccharum]